MTAADIVSGAAVRIVAGKDGSASPAESVQVSGTTQSGGSTGSGGNTQSGGASGTGQSS
ncbi:hypothetical protein ACHMXB_20810 [Arthrobacter sp. UC242_113]|uniref:hypothetical protein n=1 Tax=Arthrobacter sp. UC242_113 TaxID=3374550 RepID=UPI0037582E06